MRGNRTRVGREYQARDTEPMIVSGVTVKLIVIANIGAKAFLSHQHRQVKSESTKDTGGHLVPRLLPHTLAKNSVYKTANREPVTLPFLSSLQCLNQATIRVSVRILQCLYRSLRPL